MEERRPVKKGKGVKRGISMLIAAALTLTVTAGAFSGARALRSAQIEYEPAQMGAKVLPSQLAVNDSFLSAYVLQERYGTSYSVNDQFRKTAASNLKGGTDPLSRKTRYRHNSNDEWSTEFCWTFPTDSTVKQLWNAGELALNFSGNLYSDYHSNLWEHTSKQWDRVQVKISGINAEGEKNLLDVYSEEKDDERAQAYTKAVRPGGNQNTGVKFWAGSYDCKCGSSGVGDTVLYLVDQTAPKIIQVYAASDQAGESRLAADKGLRAGSQVYFVLEFSENIRFADNEPEMLKLALGCAWKESDQSVQAPVTADLVSVKGSRMVFGMQVPETLDGKATDIYVHSILDGQTWAGKSGQFPWALLDENGAAFSVTAGMLDNVGSRITDLAGNPIDWTNSKKTLSERAYLDDVPPALKQVTISGSRIKKASTTPKTDGGWPADMDLSAVYAATGDQLTFGVWFTEKITGLTLENVVATLDLVDENGDPVTLKAKQLVDMTGKSAFGVDASNGCVSELIFEPLTLAKEMEYMFNDEGPIRITSIRGLTSAKDIAGNVNLEMSSIPAPRQQQYLDVIPPRVETTMTEDPDPNKAGCYNPLGYERSGYMFTVPIKVTDDGSGSTNLTGRFKLGTSGDIDKTRYFWYIDTNPSFTSRRNGTQSYMGETNKFTQLGSGMTSYLHIRTVSDQDYFTDDGFFEQTLEVTTVDYAGNTAITSFPLRHQADKIAPDVQASEYTPSVSYVSDTTYQIGMSVKISVKDSFNIRSILYYWEDEGTGSQTSVTPAGNKGEVIVTRTFNETLGAGSEQISGTRKLHVLVTDEAGNSQDWTKDFAYEVGRGKSIYTVYSGSLEDPQFTPLLKMEHPDDVKTGTETKRVDSVLLLEYSPNKYYAFLPYWQMTAEEAKTSGEIAPLDEFFSAGAATTNKWYRYEISSEGDALDAATDKAQLTQGSNVAAEEVKSFITKRYAPLNVYFLASPELVNSNTAVSVPGSTITVSPGQGTVDKETIYMAAGFDPSTDYAVQITDAVDADGNSVLNKLTAPSAANGTVSALGDVGLEMEIINEKDPYGSPYGVSLIDFDNSYYDVEYSAKNDTYAPARTLVPLAAAEQQILTVADTSGSGWYRLHFHFMLQDGETTWEQVTKSFYVDKTESTAPCLSAYEKSYTQNGDGGKTVETYSGTYEEGSQPAQLNIGLAETPEGWRVNQQLTFQTTYPQTLYNDTNITDLGGALRIRAFSRRDEAGETNAQWASPTSAVAANSYMASFTPVLAGEEFAAGSYDNQQLPLVEGENIVCVQVQSPNGTVNTTELLVQASVKAPDLITWQETGKTAAETTLKPVLTEQQKLEDWIIGMAGKRYSGESDTPGAAAGYAFKAVTSRRVEFYVYDTVYGNLGLSSAEVTGVDGIKPQLSVDMDTLYDSGSYCVTLTIKDDSVSKNEVPTVTLNYSAEDSARILGIPVADVSEPVSVEVPICLEETDNPNCCKEYVSFDTANRGIYRTEVSELNAEEGSFKLEITGAFPFDETMAVGAEDIVHKLTFTVTDKNGNTVTSDEEDAATSMYYPVKNLKPDFFAGLNDDGWLEIRSQYPVSAVHSYGAGSIAIDTTDEDFMSRIYSVTTLPMINCNGTCTLECTDLFGKRYNQELEVTEFGASEVTLDVSETNYTNRPVTVTATVKEETDPSATASITSLTAVDEEGNPLADGVLGEPKGGRVTSAYLVMPQNGKVTVTTNADSNNTFTLNIRNIDTVLEPAVIFFDYNGMAQPEYINGSTDTVEGEVTAVLSCEEFLTGVDGPLRRTFRAGSKKGDACTFTYMDQAGNTGTMTAELPVNIQEKQSGTVVEDTAAPNYTVSCYGMRNDQYACQGDYIYRVGEGDSQEAAGALQQEAAESLNAALASYPAQGYRLIFDVEDDSGVKLLLRPKGGRAPTSYDDTSAAVSGVSAAGSTVTVTENAAFDVYLVDERSNITPLKGIEVTALDNKAPTVTVRQSDTMIGGDGVPYKRTYFDVENNEQIFVTDNRLGVQVDVVKEIVDDYGTIAYKNVTVYYYDHTVDGSYVFRYKDIYGNMGSVTARASGLDSARPIVNLVNWYGTTNNREPGSEGERMVNHDVTAELTVSKSIRNVMLYQYDESKENGTGDLLGENGNVTVSWVGQKATVTYAENSPAIQVRIVAANGLSATRSLPEVACIDKATPVVTGDSGTLANNNRSRTYQFTTDEPTTFAEGDMDSRTKAAREHTWTAAQSGTVTLHFADEAGNVTNYPVEVTGVDGDRLILRFNTTASDAGAKNENEISDLNLKAGGTLYVSSNKRAALKLELGAEQTVEANAWTQFTLSSKSGFHVLKATDASTGETAYVTLLVSKVDTAPPVILFPSGTLTLTEGVTVEEMNQQVRDGVTVTDTMDNAPTLTVTGVPNTVEKGLYTLTYTARDSAGNEVSATRTLCIAAEDAPTITLNGQQAQPFDTTIIQGSTLEVRVDMGQPVVVKIKKGVKTSGQMKHGATTLQADSDGVMTTELDRGYYTVYIRSQDRQEVIAYVYRDE